MQQNHIIVADQAHERLDHIVTVPAEVLEMNEFLLVVFGDERAPEYARKEPVPDHFSSQLFLLRVVQQ